MSFPPSRSSRDSTPSNDPLSNNSGSVRSRQPAWGLSASSSNSRRDLNQLDTSFTSNFSTNNARSNTPSTSNNVSSPFPGSFSSITPFGSSGRQSSRNNTSISSPFSNFQPGGPSHQLSSNQLLSARSSTNTPFSNTNAVSSTASSSTAAAQGGGSGGGGTSRSSNFSATTTTSGITSPTTTSFDRGIFNSGLSGSSTSGQSSVLKISTTQLALLLGSITEKEGKWESQAEAIRKLVREQGAEIFPSYFKRLLVGNAPRIFLSIKNRTVENSANYPLLVEEVVKGSQNFDHARQIAEVVDSSDGDIFKDFDLQAFLDHFKLDPIGNLILVSGFTKTSKSDLRSKASTILSDLYHLVLQSFQKADDTPPNVLATAASRLLLDLPDAARDGTEKIRIVKALESRYTKLNKPFPQVIRSAMALPMLFDLPSDLAQEFERNGPGVTASIGSIKDILRRFGRNNINDEQVSNAIMFMVLDSQPENEPWRLNLFIQALTQQNLSINWNNVVAGFDREFFCPDKIQFLIFYKPLEEIAANDPNFDIEQLWSSDKTNISHQLAMAISFTSLNPAELDATTIPRLQTSFDPQDAADASEDIQALAEQARHDTMISLKAVQAIVDALWDASANISPSDRVSAKEVISEKMPLFVCSAAGLPSSEWSDQLRQFLERTVNECLLKTQQHYSFILHILWKQDKNWLHGRLVQFHLEDPIKLPLLLEHAREHDWLRELCTTVTGFGFDLALMAHKEGDIDLQEWAHDKLKQGPAEFTNALAKFLLIKTEDEMRTNRGEQQAARTVSLAMKTVYAILEILEEYTRDGKEELNALERHCMQAFPRLCNYGEGFDHIIEENGIESNALPPMADAAMQEQYKKMYSGELEVKTVIERLRDCKNSEDHGKQDLFACMIHGLFDEFICFNEYPLGPLAKTAVLFGGIINYRIINNITLNVALEMVMESVRDYSPDAPMHKFGVQALLHFLARLPEWPDFCQRLLQIHGLQGKEVYARAQEVVQNRANPNDEEDGIDDINAPMTNGDDFLDNDSLVAHFRSINVDPLPHGYHFEDPTEAVEDKVLFILNNVSEDNLGSKIKELVDVLEPKHYHWFANYIVEQRAKSQPNYQSLYLNILDLINDKLLWSGVLRETFLCVRKILNAETTMKLATERANLKNLAIWLGSLTIARDRPIKHKNIAFKELLLEGWETGRLLLVIPFTCEVVGQGTKSSLFKPPNPWVDEIIGLLLELYDLPDLKIQQKFSIEIMLGNFGLSRKGEELPRGDDLKKRQQLFDTNVNDGVADTLDMFDEMGISSLNKMTRPRFTPPPVPDLENLISLPPPNGLSIPMQSLRRLVLSAVKKSIEEIIGPVVERSITIATISTKSLVQKDFAQEGDENLVRQAFENMVKSLAGSLAAVTSKEPLRNSMQQYIRGAAAELPDQSLPEGSIMICVNDNLDMACRIIQQQAEERALVEIEPAIESELVSRREHKQKYPSEPYRDLNASQWATYIPEPYKQVAGGLNPQQMEIYQQFDAQNRRPLSLAGISMDSNKQLPDVLQDFGAPVPNLATPAEQPALPHQIQQNQSRLLPPSIASTRPPSQVNGFIDAPTLWSHIEESLEEVINLCKEASESKLSELNSESPILAASIRFLSILRSAEAAGGTDVDLLASQTMNSLLMALFGDSDINLLLAQALAQIARSVLQVISVTYGSKIFLQLRGVAEEQMHCVPITAALLEAGLLDYNTVDTTLAGLIQQRNEPAQKCLADLLDILLFTAEPVCDRPEFARCFAALGELVAAGDETEYTRSSMEKLSQQDHVDDDVLSGLDPEVKRQYQLEHLFDQWCLTYVHADGAEVSLVAFMTEIGRSAGLDSKPEEMIKFLRYCVETAVREFESASKRTPTPANLEAFSIAHKRIDAVAALIVLVVKAQDETNMSKAEYFKALLLMVALVLYSQQKDDKDTTTTSKAFLRLFTSVIYFWHTVLRGSGGEKLDKQIILVFGQIFDVLQPRMYPSFAPSWVTLLMHQAFLSGVLKSGWREGSDLFAHLMEKMLSYVNSMLIGPHMEVAPRLLYRGVLRMMLVLHHDYPEFLADYHFQLLNNIGSSCQQLRNMVLSAFPRTIVELPDPFVEGLKVDRLADVMKAPNMAADLTKFLEDANVKETVDAALQPSGPKDEYVQKIVEALSPPQIFEEAKDAPLIHAVVLYIGEKAASISGTSGSLSDGPFMPLLNQIVKALDVASRHYFLEAIANQLRYPNTHTWFFSSTLLNIFGSDNTTQDAINIREQITRVLLERLVPHRPHPWGLIIVLLELMKNRTYAFWEQPSVEGNNSDVRGLVSRLLSME